MFFIIWTVASEQNCEKIKPILSKLEPSAQFSFRYWTQKYRRIYTVSIFRPLWSVFVGRFFLLYENVSSFSSLLFICLALIKLSHIEQKFSKKNFFVWLVTTLFWNIALIVHTQNFWANFLSLNNSLLSADMDLKCWQKAAYFFVEKQHKRKKRTKNGYWVNPPLGMRILKQLANSTRVVR